MNGDQGTGFSAWSQTVAIPVAIIVIAIFADEILLEETDSDLSCITPWGPMIP
ncbi:MULTISPECIES: hypothetical protein [unclassified Nocardiopsis]|uniref:hypothetical protein n=1 Tax=Nocardiopsis TaxID=2013 RepID=UPI00387B4849